MRDWRVMEWLAEAFQHLEFDDQNFDDCDYLELLPIWSAIRGGAAGMNFEYGDLYAAGGFEKAASYAETAPELLSFAKTVLEKANQRGITHVKELLIGFPELAGVIVLESKPVVLKLPSIDADRVRLENGNFVPKEITESVHSMVGWTQISFRVDGIIPFRELEVITL